MPIQNKHLYLYQQTHRDMDTTYIVTKEVYNEEGKLTTKKEVIKTGNEKEVVKYFSALITRTRTKADRCRTTENPSGYKLTFVTKKKVQATVNGKVFVFELKKRSNAK